MYNILVLSKLTLNLLYWYSLRAAPLNRYDPAQSGDLPGWCGRRLHTKLIERALREYCPPSQCGVRLETLRTVFSVYRRWQFVKLHPSPQLA